MISYIVWVFVIGGGAAGMVGKCMVLLKMLVGLSLLLPLRFSGPLPSGGCSAPPLRLFIISHAVKHTKITPDMPPRSPQINAAVLRPFALVMEGSVVVGRGGFGDYSTVQKNYLRG